MKFRLTIQTIPLMAVLFSLGLITTAAQAQITYSRTYSANWEWLDSNFILRSDSFNNSTSSSGVDNHSISVPQMHETGFDSNVLVTPDGKIKTYSRLYGKGFDFQGEETFVSLDMEYRNLIRYNDILTTDEPNADYVVFKADFHGKVRQYSELIRPVGVTTYVGLMETKSIFDIYEPVGGGDIHDFFSDRVLNAFDPRFISITPSVNHEAYMRFYLADGQAAMNLTFEDIAKYKIHTVDALGFFMEVEHDFLDTFTLSANVYDSSGMLLEGVKVNSSLGHTYANFTTVPEPAAGGFALLLGGMICFRRRR